VTCLWRGLVSEEMTADEIRPVYREAAAAGCRINSIWGGEPLVREDLPEIVSHSDAAGLNTILITNGRGLPERAGELAAHLSGVILSLDHPSPRHDELRGMPGLFEAVVSSIELFHRSYGRVRVVLNSVISSLNADVVLELARLARDLRVGIYFNPIETGMRDSEGLVPTKAPLAVTPARLSELFGRLRSYKRAGWPILNSQNYLGTFIGGRKRYTCHARKVAIELRPNGDLMDCLDRSRPVANVRTTSLLSLLRRPEIRRRRMAGTLCQVCNNANVIDCSYLWQLRPESILSLVRAHLRR
jgi:MoaA/NifB/PqqE/SkfB family radical SAM enzyme